MGIRENGGITLEVHEQLARLDDETRDILSHISFLLDQIECLEEVRDFIKAKANGGDEFMYRTWTARPLDAVLEELNRLRDEVKFYVGRNLIRLDRAGNWEHRAERENRISVFTYADHDALRREVAGYVAYDDADLRKAIERYLGL